MKFKKLITVLLIFLLYSSSFVVCASSSEDTHETRLKAANQYLQVASISKMIDDSIKEMSKQVPLEKRDDFKRLMKKGMRVDFIEQIAIDSMVKIFTAEELEALAKFYGSKTGTSVMNKMGVYMAEIMPAMQQEIIRVVKEIQQEGKQK